MCSNDDAVIFSESKEELQNGIDQLYKYNNSWKLKLNTQKSFVMVFKRGQLSKADKWFYGDHELSITTRLPYLGILITSNGSFHQAQITLSEQATKAIFKMYKNLNRFTGLYPKFMMNMFDKMIAPILNYASEVWGYHDAPHIERVHLKYCKRVLGVKLNTQNDFIYGELGRFPMKIIRIYNMVKYWLNIVHGKKSQYVTLCYQNSLNTLLERNTKGWTHSIRHVLQNNGFGDVWENQGVGDIQRFLSIFKCRLRDIWNQEWTDRLQNSSRASFYRIYKSNPEFSNYLNEIPVKGHREALCRLLVSSHQLRIESGRWDATVRERRYCFACPNKLEDEYHFVIECALYQELRQNLIRMYCWHRPSVFKFQQLITSQNRRDIIGLGKFAFRPFNFRSASLAAR